MSYIGKVVKVKPGYKGKCPEGREDNETAVIVAELGYAEGAVKTDRDLNGSRYWNIDSLEIIP